MVSPADDRFHPRNDDPHWNESGYFSFSVPERRLHGWVYFYHRPNLAISAGGPVIWDDTGSEIYNCVYWDWNPCQPMPDGTEMHEFNLANSLSLTTIETLESYQMRYNKYDCELDLVWTAIGPPHEMSRGDDTENPSFSGWLSDVGIDEPKVTTGHFDQAGRIRGTVTVEGTTHQIDSFSNRDRTWGPRHVKRVRTGYSWGTASETQSFLAGSRSFEPVDEDPMFGTTEQVHFGWYTKDGVRSNIVSGTRRLERSPEDGRPISEEIVARDEMGRTLRAVGSSVSLLHWTGYTYVLDTTCFMQWEFDGATAWGELHDYYDFRTHRQMHRRLSSTGAKVS